MVSSTLLVILDGWGYSEATENNAIALANTPVYDRLLNDCPMALLEASGESVGLPQGQMGNSEVGHLHIGAGRQVSQSLERINQAVATHTLADNDSLNDLLDHCQQRLHLIGLLSPGGVHSHEAHLFALLDIAAQQNIQHIAVHAILDGRDTPPQSALGSLQACQKKLDALLATHDTLQSAVIASLCGRYYAMDRDQRWDRTAKAYALYTATDWAAPLLTPEAALHQAYGHAVTDEFLEPTRTTDIPILDGDSVIMVNFRADRMRQLTQALTLESFDGFPRANRPTSHLASMTSYQKDLPAQVLFPQTPLADTLGQCVADHGLAQCRIAETEKFAHVTYFLNGGSESIFPKEDRLLIRSDKSVPTYDHAPEMQAKSIADAVIQTITEGKHDLIICNFANADMVGHTGNLEATKKAVEAIDVNLGLMLDCLADHQGQAIITADHGNAESMHNPDSEQPHTAHTSNPVPMIYVGSPAQGQTSGKLSDIAPTLLQCLKIDPPKTMSGQSLIQWDD